MKFDLSLHARDVMEHRNISAQWVAKVLEYPSKVVVVDEYEVHYYANIESYENRCLKVVFNPVTALVITAFFDRKMRKRGC